MHSTVMSSVRVCTVPTGVMAPTLSRLVHEVLRWAGARNGVPDTFWIIRNRRALPLTPNHIPILRPNVWAVGYCTFTCVKSNIWSKGPRVCLQHSRSGTHCHCESNDACDAKLPRTGGHHLIMQVSEHTTKICSVHIFKGVI